MVKEKTKQVKKIWNKFYSIALGEPQEGSRRFLFLFFSWMIFLLFLSFSFLAAKNPFVLFLPMEIFDLPKEDLRKERTVYVSDGEESIFSSQRMVFVHDEIKKDIAELIEEIGRPPHFSKPATEGDKFFGTRLKKMPNLSTSLLSIWIREESKEIVLDFSSEEIMRELSVYRFVKSKETGEDEDEDTDSEGYYSAPPNFIDSKTAKEMEEKKERILGLTLSAIQKTLLSNFPDYKTVSFHLDGKRNVGQGVLKAFKNP